MSRQRSAVECDTRPSDALHVWHVGVVIQVRVVLGLFLDDAEDTGRRFASLLAARYRRPQDPAFGVVCSDPLVAERNDGHHRLNRRACDARFERHHAFFPTVCRARMIAHHHHSSPARNDKVRTLQPGQTVPWIEKTRRSANPARVEKIHNAMPPKDKNSAPWLVEASGERRPPSGHRSMPPTRQSYIGSLRL